MTTMACDATMSSRYKSDFLSCRGLNSFGLELIDLRSVLGWVVLVWVFLVFG